MRTSRDQTPHEARVAALHLLAEGHAAVMAPDALLALSAAQLEVIVARLDPQAGRLPEPIERVLTCARSALAAIARACDAPVILAPAPGIDVRRVD